MKKRDLSKHKLLLTFVGVVAAFVLGVAVNQFITLRSAHGSFSNYYAFRGCAQLLKKGPDYGVCKTNTGQTIKIVEYHGKWYLNNDLPLCVHGMCL